jgi:hypothetical protein
VSELSRPQIESPAHDDLHARRRLQCAQGMFQKWPEGFAGFSAAITCRQAQEYVAGEVRVFTAGRVELLLRPGPLSAWAESALGAISMARTPSFFKDGDGRFPITFEPEDEHPLGRGVRIHLGGRAWRAYRIDAKGRIRQQENAEPASRATATYDGFVRTCPGRVLPSHIQILEWDVVTQTLTQTAAIEDAYECREHVWLPVWRRATVAHGSVQRELILELSEHELL